MVNKAKAAVLATLLISAPSASAFAGFMPGMEFDYIPLPDEPQNNNIPKASNKKTAPSPEELEAQAKELARIKKESQDQKSQILRDTAMLSDGNSVFRKQLAEKDIFMDQRGLKDFRLDTPNGSFAFKEIAEIEKGNFKAKSMAVHAVNGNGKVSEEPSGVSFSFGGSSKFSSIPKKLATPSIPIPFEEKFLVNEVIRQTRYKFFEKYDKAIYDKDVDVSISAQASDSKLGMMCHKELQKQNINSKLNLYQQDAPKITTGLIGSFIMAGVKANNLANIASSAIDGEYENQVGQLSPIKMFDEVSKNNGRGIS